jgi:hypothetical protein
MKTEAWQHIVHEIALATDTAEETVALMYAEVLEDFRKDARILDFLPLLAARRVRETLRVAGKAPVQR